MLLLNILFCFSLLLLCTEVLEQVEAEALELEYGMFLYDQNYTWTAGEIQAWSKKGFIFSELSVVVLFYVEIIPGIPKYCVINRYPVLCTPWLQ